jgi:ABC-type cobalamin/Fe3+-siderophores transport system ATPase subunit
VRATCGLRSGGGLLLIGPPGVGKTTLLRDVAHMLSEAMDREVVIVDTRWVGLGARLPALDAANLASLCMPHWLLSAVQWTTHVSYCPQLFSCPVANAAVVPFST